ncbi:hypothetical protein BH11MYX1_BH11MYX1_15890 [soil metagenome]
MADCKFGSESWRTEFERQATTELHDRLYRGARARLRMYAGRSKHVNDADVDDIVMAALADTFEGTLSWNPETKPLERHLLNAIAFRVRDQARFKKRHGEEEYDEEATGEPRTSYMICDAGDGLDLRLIADQIVPELQERAADDPEVLLLLELFGDGLSERADVMTDAQMQSAQYDNAIQRLRRMTRQLPKQTREAAMAALT